MGIFNGVFIKPKRLTNAPLERYSGFDIRDLGLLFRDSRFVDSLIRDSLQLICRFVDSIIRLSASRVMLFDIIDRY